METIAGYTVTGRQLRGPASDLVELSAQNGLRLTAIVFHPEYRGHRALNEALDVVRGFLESPLVTNLCELSGEDKDAGAFVYPTGQCWSVAEVIRALADMGQPEGHVRAGLELMHAAGEILIEAAERGEMDGVYSHGGVTPWRLMLKKDGQVTVIGHALPQVEILQFHEDDSRVPREDSFRYCPPERIEFSPENISSDLFGLSLIAFELMTGRPVYDGLVNDIRQQAARGEGSRRLFRFRDKLPQSVRDLLTKALRPDIPDRYPSGEEFLYAVRQVLSGPDATGESLMDLMKQVSSRGKRTGQALQSSKTLMVDKDKLRAMLDDGEEEAPARQKWSAPARSRREAPRRQEAEALPPQPPVVTDDAPQVSKPKWSKPTRRRQPAPRAAEPDVQVEVSPPQRPRSSADNAADLLARLRASSTSATPEHSSSVADARRSDANLIQSILKDSGPPADTTDAAISAVPPVPVPEPGPRIIPGRRRPPARKPAARSPEEIARLISQSIANTNTLTRSSENAAAEEEAARQKAADEEAARQKAAEAEAAQKKAAAEAEAAQKQKEAARQRAAAEAARKKAAAEAAARKKAADEDAARKKVAAEAEAARKKAADEEAARKQAAEADAVRKKQAAEAAARKRMELAARKEAEVAAAAAARQVEIERELMQEMQAAAAAAQQKAAEERRLQEAEAARELAALRSAKERADAEVSSLRRALASAQKQRSAEIAAAVQAEVARLLKAQAEADAGQVSSLKRAVLEAVRSAPRPEASASDAAFPSEVAAAVAGQVGFSGTGQLVRAPDSISMSSSREGVASFNFQRGPSGRTVRIRLPLSASAAEAVAWLLGSVLPVRADLQGNISGWYRIERDGQIFPASRRLGELDAQQTYMLRFVPNQTVHADIDASAAGSPVRFVAPVGVAVPAVTLVDHLAAWLGLPAGDWMLEANGQLLGAYGIVHDVLQGPGLVRMRLLQRGTR